MSFHPDPRPDLGDLPALVNQERRALDSEKLPTVEILFLPDAVRTGDAPIVVAQEREIEIVLAFEPHVALRVVAADAEDHRALRAHPGEVVPEAARFFRATRRVVLRVEVQDDLLAAEVLQGKEAPVVRRQGEVGRRLTDRNHRGTAPCTRPLDLTPPIRRRCPGEAALLPMSVPNSIKSGISQRILYVNVPGSFSSASQPKVRTGTPWLARRLLESRQSSLGLCFGLVPEGRGRHGQIHPKPSPPRKGSCSPRSPATRTDTGSSRRRRSCWMRSSS